MADKYKLRITPRARQLYEKLKAAKDRDEIIDIRCALHSAVGLMPWQNMPIEELMAAFEHEPRAHNR